MTFQLMPKALQRLSLQINIMLSCLLGKIFSLDWTRHIFLCQQTNENAHKF